jgi:hypothetical protein
MMVHLSKKNYEDIQGYKDFYIKFLGIDQE